MGGLRQLAAFDAVAAELHFGRAADRLGISQAAISQLVRRLEQEHGVTLFERSSRHVALTTAGAALIESARATLRAHAAFADAARAAASGAHGTLRIAPSEATVGPLAMLLDGFRQEHPSISVELITVSSAEKPGAVRSGVVEVAFARSAMHAAGVHVEPLWTEPMIAVVPASCVPAGTVAADPATLATLPFIIIDRGANAAMHDELVAEARRAGVEPRLGPPLIGGREGLAAVASGAGWTLVPASSPPTGLPQVVGLPFLDSAPRTTVSVLWRMTGASAATRAFVDHARRVARSGALP